MLNDSDRLRFAYVNAALLSALGTLGDTDARAGPKSPLVGRKQLLAAQYIHQAQEDYRDGGIDLVIAKWKPFVLTRTGIDIADS
jgi:hypothetical protein